MQKEMANFVRRMTRSLGEGIPDHWTDEQVLQFMTLLLKERES